MSFFDAEALSAALVWPLLLLDVVPLLFAVCDALLPEDADLLVFALFVCELLPGDLLLALLVFAFESLLLAAVLTAVFFPSLLEACVASFAAVFALFTDFALLFTALLSLPELVFEDVVCAPLALFAVLAADELLPVVFCALLLLDADALRLAFCETLLFELADLLALALAVLAALSEEFRLALLVLDAVLSAFAALLAAAFAALLASDELFLLTFVLAEFVLALEASLLTLLAAFALLALLAAAELVLLADRFAVELLPKLLAAALLVEFLLFDVSLRRLLRSEC